jgi:RNA polymerase sigma-70 factor (ECF subfamily)
MVFTCERKQMLAGQAILSETATTVQSQEYALEDIVRQHARLVYRVAYGVLRNHHEAEDATQETFVRVLRYGKKLGKVEDHKSWLARIAWRVAVDRSQQHSRKQEIPLESFDQPFEPLASSEVGAEQALLGKQVGARLEKLVAGLPEKLRAPLILSAIDEMSPREVAVALGINEAAVRSRVFRARQILREKLTQQGNRK